MKKYPDGKLNKSDDGAIRIAVYIENGRVVLNFGTDLSWIGFDKETLKKVIEELQEKYNEI